MSDVGGKKKRRGAGIEAVREESSGEERRRSGEDKRSGTEAAFGHKVITVEADSGWSPAAHSTFPVETREFVNSIFAVYCVGDYGDTDESSRVTRLHDLPPELLFEIVATALLAVQCRSYGIGVLKESTDVFDVFKLDASE